MLKSRARAARQRCQGRWLIAVPTNGLAVSMPPGSAPGPSLDCVGHEPPLDRRGRRVVDVVPGEQVADDLTRPRDLAASAAGPARVRQGEIELGERTGQGRGQ